MKLSLKQVKEENKETRERFELKIETGSLCGTELHVGEKGKIWVSVFAVFCFITGKEDSA